MTRVYRPRATLVMAVGLTAVLVFAAAIGWQLLPANIQVLFTGEQLATLVFFILVMIAVMLGIALSTVRADAEGLVVGNGPRRHRIPWSQIEGFRFTAHDPWAYVLITQEPGSRPLIALQRVDGDRARAAVDDLRRLWQEHAGTAS